MEWSRIMRSKNSRLGRRPTAIPGVIQWKSALWEARSLSSGLSTARVAALASFNAIFPAQVVATAAFLLTFPSTGSLTAFPADLSHLLTILAAGFLSGFLTFHAYLPPSGF